MISIPASGSNLLCDQVIEPARNKDSEHPGPLDAAAVVKKAQKDNAEEDKMDPFTLAFTSGYLGNLGATLTGNILSEASRRIKRAISGEEIEQAFNRCIQTGIVAVAQSAVSQEPEKTELLKDILDRFFQNPDVGGELSEILNGREPDREQLNRLFKEAGYDPKTLPGIQFDLAINAFAAAFLSAATLEQPTGKTGSSVTLTAVAMSSPASS